MAKGPASEHEVEGLFAIPDYLDPIGTVQLPNRLEGELDLKGTVVDKKNVNEAGKRGSGEAGRLDSHQA
jgi:hypothetical protein